MPLGDPSDTSGRRDPKHWSEEVRRRARERTGAPAEPESAAPEVESAESETVRDRIEARLRDAEMRREEIREQPPPEPESEEPERVELEPRDEPAPEPDEVLPPRLAALIATCGGVGRIPFAPGTAGALVGLGAFALTMGLPAAWQLGLLGVATAAGWRASQAYACAVGREDPNEVVVDEFCGMWLALVLAAPDLVVAAGAFVAFRVLDIAKPPPIRWLERLPGGSGIMADDLAAGLAVRAFLFVFLAR